MNNRTNEISSTSINYTIMFSKADISACLLFFYNIVIRKAYPNIFPNNAFFLLCNSLVHNRNRMWETLVVRFHSIRFTYNIHLSFYRVSTIYREIYKYIIAYQCGMHTDDDGACWNRAMVHSENENKNITEKIFIRLASTCADKWLKMINKKGVKRTLKCTEILNHFLDAQVHGI